MTIILESGFEMTLVSKSRKVRNDYLFDMTSDCRFYMTAQNFRHEIKLKSFYELLQNACYSQSNVIY